MFHNLQNSKVISFSDKIASIVAHDQNTLIDALKSIEKYTSQGYYIAGFISYEAGRYLADKQISHKELTMPLLHFEIFATMEESEMVLQEDTAVQIYDLQYSETSEDYAQKIMQIKNHLKNGDTYQTNYTIRMNFKSTAMPKDLFFALCGKQKTEFAAFMDFDDYSILSLSPELFLKKTGNKLVSKPMKGTSKVTINNDQTTAAMLSDSKTISENSIIVDLIRNDMSIIAEKGSVEVINPFEIQTFGTVNQMISTVQCEAKSKTFYEIIKALFPCGSITGAPKIRTMGIISENEDSSREVYCGSIGYILPNNDFCFNVAIRTPVFNKKTNQYTMGVGGGVIYESKTSDEFDECLLKSQFLRSVNNFEIFETMKSVEGVIQHYELHLERLQKSAAYFGFNFKNPVLPQIPLGEKRVRMALKQSGEYQFRITEIEPVLGSKIAISKVVIRSDNVFLQHKTSMRAIYNDEYDKYSKQGFYDVVFLNEQGFITEASRHNIFIKKNNQWLTPSLNAGALPGVMRTFFMKNNHVTEKDITLNELESADEIYLSNAVRGLVRVEL